ncbi:MAG: hypothetical protein D6748_00045 [Calditrichaeota bacterium]|nr:MAG: hypothetical protein D6748_00045 [Calditrichota bacterium]
MERIYQLKSLLIGAITLLSSTAIAQPGFSPKVNRISDINSFWAMAQLGGGIGYLIMGVLAVGVFLILIKVIELILDKKNSRDLLRISFQDKSIAEIEEMVSDNGGSLLKNTILHLIHFFRAGGDARDMHQELIEYLEKENEKFEAYRNWLSFLSDSAGALGLLGTVWGVFLTFFGGNLDSEKILNGMGVALITTLLGLVVSLIINLFSTQLYSAFQRRLNLIGQKGDEFRLHLFRLARQREKASETIAPSPTPVQPVASTPQKTRVAEKPVPEATNEINLKVVKVRIQEIPVHSLVKGAIQACVIKGGDKPLKNHPISVETEGPLFLNDKKTSAQLSTNEEGLVSIDIFSGEEIGTARVHLKSIMYPTKKVSLTFAVVPGEPQKLLIIGGNDQAALIGSELPEMFQVKVTDKFGNPVPNVPVQFKLTNGSGVLDGDKPLVIKKSDANGVVRAHMRLGKQSGFHTVQASLNGTANTSVEFRILCKSS